MELKIRRGKTNQENQDILANYLVKSRNHKVIYLGQNLPFQDICEVYKVYQPEYMMTIATSNPNQDTIQAYINQIGQKFSETTVFLSGYQIVGQDLNMPKNAVLIHKIEDLVEQLDNLS